MNLCLDIGGTNIRIAEVSGTKISNKKVAQNPNQTEKTLKTIIDLISQYKKPSQICISVAGFEQDGKIQGSPNTSLNGVKLKSAIQNKFRAKVYIQNDARCATLAEMKFGAGKNLNNFVLLTLGTGIGGGIVINKKLYLGEGIAGEICNQIIENGKTFEQLASGSAAINFANDKGLRNISGAELNELANQKNKIALEVYEEVGYYLGIGISNLAFILSPQAFIFGGGFSEVKHIFPKAEKVLKERYPFKKIKILKAKFSQDGGLIGANSLPNSKSLIL